MTVDYVEQDSDTAGMRGLDQRLKLFRAAIGRVWRVEQHAVITPIAPAREVRHGHDLDGGDAEPGQMVELFDSSAKGALTSEGADMDFVQNDVVPVPAGPVHSPIVARRIDDLTR